MRKEKQRYKTGSLAAIVQGILFLLGFYIIGVLSLALVVSKGILSESDAFFPVCIIGGVAAWCGGKRSLKKTESKRKLCVLVPAVLFSLVYAVFGMWMCDNSMEFCRVSAFVLCVLFGGAISMTTKRRKKRGGKRIEKR